MGVTKMRFHAETATPHAQVRLRTPPLRTREQCHLPGLPADRSRAARQKDGQNGGYERPGGSRERWGYVRFGIKEFCGS